MNNENGFTLVEMMIVLFVITILLLITIPNVSSHQTMIGEKGCEGLKNMVESQVQAYWIENNKRPTSLTELDEFKENDLKCPDGRLIYLDNGQVKISEDNGAESAD